jgi:hypothetical protein
MGGKIMAQTKNGQKIYDHYVQADVMAFASDWTEFSIYYSRLWDNRKNYTSEWWKWCDEFAEWVLTYRPFNGDPFGLIGYTEEEE